MNIESKTFICDGREHKLIYLTDKTTVIVQRKFTPELEWNRIPSGWYFEDLMNSNNLSLCIDGGTEWWVEVPNDVWNEFRNEVKSKHSIKFTISGIVDFYIDVEVYGEKEKQNILNNINEIIQKYWQENVSNKLSNLSLPKGTSFVEDDELKLYINDELIDLEEDPE